MFSDVTALQPVDEGRFRADVDAEWTIGGKPNGGYLLAMLGRAAVAVTDQDHVIAASAHYLRSPDPGPVDTEARVLRAGVSTSQVHLTMRQRDKPCVDALVAVSTLGLDTKPFWN